MAKKSAQEMDETASEGLFKTVREPTVWTCGQDDSIWALSTNTNNYVLGRDLPAIHILHQTPYKECVSREACEISYTEVENSARMDKEEGSEDKMLSNHDKSNIFSSKQQDREIYVRSNYSINTRTASNIVSGDSQNTTTESSSVKGEPDANIQRQNRKNAPTPGGIAPNLSHCVTWTKCQFVHPHNNNRKCGNNEPILQMSEANGLDVSRAAHKGSRKSPMIVEMISNETDRQRIATFLLVEFDEKSNHNYHLNEIREFGFTHIIILGTFQYGSIFLDCYGRVFKMDVMSGVLWFIGNSLEEARTKTWSQAAAWTVEEDGSIDDSEYDPETECNIMNRYGFEDQKKPKVEKAQSKVQKKKGEKKKSKKNSTIF